jgi:hypothetical protein
VRRAKAINAVRKIQEISVKLGNDKMSLEEINAIIADVRKKTKNLRLLSQKLKFWESLN